MREFGHLAFLCNVKVRWTHQVADWLRSTATWGAILCVADKPALWVQGLSE